jgi:hypothetical protein
MDPFLVRLKESDVMWGNVCSRRGKHAKEAGAASTIAGPEEAGATAVAEQNNRVC